MLNLDPTSDCDWIPPDASAPDPRLFLALSLVDGLGAATFHRLLSVFGTPEGVFQAKARELTEACPRMGAGTLIALGRGPDLLEVDRQMEACRRHGVRLVSCRGPGYPGPLLDLPNPPPILFLKGDWRLIDRRALAVVGTRHPSPYGAGAARKFGGQLAEAGWTVVSGLARGVDTLAHEAAILGGGRTVAILGSGLDRLYPRENADLARRIAAGRGCVLTEFPMGVAPLPEHFPRRNRLISALSLGTLVVEAGNDSGSLITADFALDQGREVFAVPGAIQAPGTRGTHRLIQEGAHLVEEVADILRVFEGLPQAVPGRRFAVRGWPADPSRDPVQLEVPLDSQPQPFSAGAAPVIRSAVPIGRGRPAPARDRTLKTETLEAAMLHPAGSAPEPDSRPARGLQPLSGDSRADLKDSHRFLLEALDLEPVSLDGLVERLRLSDRHREGARVDGLPGHRLLADLLQLELLGRVKRLPGARFRLT